MKDNRQDLNRRADRRKRRLHNDATSVGGAAVGGVFSAQWEPPQVLRLELLLQGHRQRAA
jgi:hypothetical protein